MNVITNHRFLIYFFVSEAFLSFGIGLASYAQPLYYQSAGLSDAVIGILFATNSACSGLSALVLGSIADRLGASRVFKVASWMVPTGFLLMTVSPHLESLLFATAFQGVGGAMLMSTENVVLSSLTRGVNRAGVLSKFVAMYMSVMGAGVISSGFVCAAWGYRHTLLLGACIGLVAPVMRLFIRVTDAKSTQLFRVPTPRVLAMGVFTLIMGAANGLFNPFLTLVLKDQFKLADALNSTISASTNFMIAFGSFLVSMLLKRFRRERTLWLSFSLSFVFTGLMILAGQAWSFVSLYMGRTAMLSVPSPIVDALFLDLAHETEYVQMFGVRVFGSSVGQSFGSYTGGTMLDHHLMGGALLTSGICVLLALAYLLWLLRRLGGKAQPKGKDHGLADGSSLSL